MDPKQYLKAELTKMADSFPSVTIRYGLDESIDFHIVEFTPQYEYDNNTELDRAWLNLSTEFQKSFPAENITFISDNSPLCLDSWESSFNEKFIESKEFELIYDQLLNFNILEPNINANPDNYFDFSISTDFKFVFLKGTFENFKKRNLYPVNIVISSKPIELCDDNYHENSRDPSNNNLLKAA